MGFFKGFFLFFLLLAGCSSARIGAQFIYEHGEASFGSRSLAIQSEKKDEKVLPTVLATPR